MSMMRLMIAGAVPVLLLVLPGALLVAAGTDSSTTTVLYDGALNTGTPSTQGLFYAANGPNATQSFAAGVTTLDTTAQRSESAGYSAGIFNKPAPTLNRAAGYSVRFTAQLVSENHDGSDKNDDGIGDRAGFSVIALSSDSQGIELGFWADEVWAQDAGTPLFTHAEGAPFDTSAGLITYDLAIQGDSYVLSSGGTSILSGALRDYSAFTGTPNPYRSTNFIFLGDDTSSAQASTRLSFVAVTTGTPEISPTSIPPPDTSPTATPTRPYNLFLPALSKST